MADDTVTVTTTATTVAKPGWKTTEFWLKLAAIALTAVYASGALTSNTALAIAGIAATILGALGYTVSRTIAKAALVLLVLGLAGSTQLACTTVRPVAANVVTAELDCTAPALLGAVTSLGRAGEVYLAGKIAGRSVDTPAIKADLKAVASKAWSCAVTTALAALLNQPVARTLTGPPGPDIDVLRAAAGEVKLELGVATVKTAAGVL